MPIDIQDRAAAAVAKAHALVRILLGMEDGLMPAADDWGWVLQMMDAELSKAADALT